VLLVMLSAIGFTATQAETKKKVQVEVSFGSSYANALGESVTATAKQLSENELARSLGELIRYFDFVPSGIAADHRLIFRIDNPPDDSGGELFNILDSYVFLTLISEGSQRGERMHWVFQDAASNLSGVKSPELIASKLSKDVQQAQRDGIVKGLLNEVSFTENGTFHGEGWTINHSRLKLCMDRESELKIFSSIPDKSWSDDFTAEVKSNESDDKTIFSITDDDVTQLLVRPADARVLAVHVVTYKRRCEGVIGIAENDPDGVSFSSGGVQ
jgi:hypothetical protein